MGRSLKKSFKMEQKDRKFKKKDKNQKSGPQVYNMQTKGFLREKNKTQKNGRDKNQRNNSCNFSHFQGHVSIG